MFLYLGDHPKYIINNMYAGQFKHAKFNFIQERQTIFNNRP